MTIEQYLSEKTKEFHDQYFYSFYLDVIHRKRSFYSYVNDDDLFREHLENTTHYDFLELRKLFNISKKEARIMDHDIMANNIRKPLYVAIKKSFLETLHDKQADLSQQLNEPDNTNREINTLTQYKENIEQVTQELK